MSLFLAIALLLAQDEGFGDVWVRTEPGIVVYLDGREMGLTTQAELGMRLRNLDVGRHELTLSMPGGGTAKFAVDVAFGRTTELQVPALALRARRDPGRNGGLELRLEPFQPECFATIRGIQHDLASAMTRINDVAPGKQTISIACGSRILRSEIDVPPARIVVVRADVRQNKITIVEARPRVVDVEVRESRDTLVFARIPASARRALIASLGSAEVLDARMAGLNRVQVVFRTTSSNETNAILSRLRLAEGVAGIANASTTELARRFTTKIVLVVEPDDTAPVK